jgi:hypothetical protein
MRGETEGLGSVVTLILILVLVGEDELAGLLLAVGDGVGEIEGLGSIEAVGVLVGVSIV